MMAEHRHLGEILLDSAVRFGNEPAIRYGENVYSYSEVVAAVHNAIDEFLNLRPEVTNPVAVGEADDSCQPDPPVVNVALMIPNCPSFPVFYFAALWQDAVVVPVNPLLSEEEIRLQIEHSRSTWFVVHQSWLEKAERALESISECQVISVPDDWVAESRVNCKDGRLIANGQELSEWRTHWRDGDSQRTAVILYTSGSSGSPKGVELTHRNLLHNSWLVSEEKFSYRDNVNRLGPGHVGLAALPLSHVFGLTNMLLGLWYQGGCLSLMKRFEPLEAIHIISHHQVTFFAGVPAMYFDLVEAATSCHSLMIESLQFCVCGGARLSPNLKNEFLDSFGICIQESYGMTETSPMICCQRINEAEKNGNVGRPFRDIQLRILSGDRSEVEPGEVGELFVRGPNVFKSYFRLPPEIGSPHWEGWFGTGDLAQFNADGTLTIVERSTEIITRGGYQVNPGQIEEVLLSLDWVGEAVVFGVPDNRLGQEIKAVISIRHSKFVVGNQSVKQAAEHQLIQGCKTKLAAYKWPRIIEIMDSLPRGPTGKISRLALQSMS